MSICLCNNTADIILELAAQKLVELEPASPDPTTFVGDASMATECLAGLEDRLSYPLDLLVGSAAMRRNGPRIACHVWNGSLPRNCFYALDEGVYVASPELTLLQQACQLHQASLCQMLGRYVGTWSPAADRQGLPLRRAPLTTLEALGVFLSEVGNQRGAGNLRYAVAYTCEGAASAPETSLQLALVLPPELHGFGLPQPIMNYEVGLGTYARSLYPHDSIRVDLCWRDKRFGLEYQGEEHGKQLGDDCSRWFAARVEGYELWYVAKEQLRDAALMDCIGRQVAERIGFEIDEELWPTKTELQELLDVLAGVRHPRPVSYRTLSQRRKAIRRHLKERERQQAIHETRKNGRKLQNPR